MEEWIETRVPPHKVWDAWERAHTLHGGQAIREGQKGISKGQTAKGFQYQVLDVVKNERFSVLWKTFFVRLLFSHSVSPTKRGSTIRYNVQIKGLFAWPVRWLLGNKIRQNIRMILKAIVKQLEEDH